MRLVAKLVISTSSFAIKKAVFDGLLYDSVTFFQKAIMRQKMLYKSYLAPDSKKVVDVSKKPCLFPKKISVQKYDFSSISTILRVNATFRIGTLTCKYTLFKNGAFLRKML